MLGTFEKLLAFRYLRARRQEGLISVIAGFSLVGIALGVATLIIVMAVMNGFRAELLKKILDFNGHMTIYSPLGDLKDSKVIQTKLEGMPGIINAIPLIEGQALLSFHGKATGIMVRGISKEDLKKKGLVFKNIYMGDIESFDNPQRDLLDQAPTILIGKRLAERMQLWPGDSLTLVSPETNATAFGTMPRLKSFKVGAIFEAGMSDYDNNIIFIPLKAAQSFFRLPEGNVSKISLFVDKPHETSGYAKTIESLLGTRWRIVNWQQTYSGYFEAIQVERSVMFIILTLIIVVAAFNIISSLIMLVKDKTQDIAILRTMGASRGMIMRVFFLTGSTIGVIGTFLGLLLGLLFTSNIESIRQFLQKLTNTTLFSPEIYFLSKLPAIVEPAEVILTISMALFLTFLATLYPSWRAARLMPVEALYHE